MKDQDEIFMARFRNRMALEPNPSWAKQKTPFPWMEVAWAAAASLMLAVYWTELRFGFMSVVRTLGYWLSLIPPTLSYIILAGLIGGMVWFSPRFNKEI